MRNILASGSRKVSAVLAALAITASITGFSVLGAASAASADGAEAQAAYCTTGMSATGSGESIRYYAWARCYNSQPAPYRFRLEWSCVGQSSVRQSAWHVADGSRIVGYCPSDIRADMARARTTA